MIFFLKPMTLMTKMTNTKKPLKSRKYRRYRLTCIKKINVNSYDKIHIFTTPLWHMTKPFFKKKPCKINVLRLKFVINQSYDKLAGAGDGLGSKTRVSPWNVGKFAGLGLVDFNQWRFFVFHEMMENVRFPL